MSQHIDVAMRTTDLSAEDRITPYLWLTFVLCLFGNILAGIVSTLMSAHLPTVVAELTSAKPTINSENVSAIINATFLLGWAIGGFISGVITDKIGRVKSLALSVAAYSIFSVLVGLSTSWELIVVFRLLSGFAVGGLMVVSPTLLSEIWPESSRAIILGIDSIGFPIGIFSTGIVTAVSKDWRQSFMLIGVGLLLSLIFIICLRESGRWSASAKHNSLDRIRMSHEIRAAILRGSVVFGTMLVGLWALFSWIPTWEQTIVAAGSDGRTERATTMMLLGGCGLTGGFISGWFANAIGVRTSMLICFAGCFAMSLVLFGTNAVFSPVIFGETALLALFFGASQGLLSVYITQLFPSEVRATATGICFNAGRFFTAAAVFFVGTLVTLLGGYGNALLAFSTIFLVGFLTLLKTEKK